MLVSGRLVLMIGNPVIRPDQERQVAFANIIEEARFASFSVRAGWAFSTL